LLRLNYKRPYDFPAAAVLQDLDAHQKNIARVALAEDAELPRFFGRFKTATQILPISRMTYYDQPRDLNLFGKPDLMLEFSDQKVGIIDLKTSHVKGTDHPQFHGFRAQLNFYAYLAGLLPAALDVSMVGLLYFQLRKADDAELVNCYDDSGIYAPFHPTLVEVDLDPDGVVGPLLDRIRELLDMAEAPAPRKGCTDCALIKAHAKLFELDETDAETLAPLTRMERDRLIARNKYVATQDQEKERETAVRIFRYASDPLGVVANWDWGVE